METDIMGYCADIMKHCVYQTMKNLLTSPHTYTCIDKTILAGLKKMVESKK